jgi:hypothetical protein
MKKNKKTVPLRGWAVLCSAAYESADKKLYTSLKFTPAIK